MGTCRTTARKRTARFHGNDRFRPADAARDPCKPAWISEGFQVEQNDARRIIDFPVLKQVVARDIRFIPNADECRDTQPAFHCKRQNRQSQGTALRRHCDVARRWKYRRKRCVELNSRIGVQESHAIGTDHPHSVAPNSFEKLLLKYTAGFVCFGETGCDHNNRLDAARGAVIHNSQDVIAGNRHDCEIDRLGNFEH